MKKQIAEENAKKELKSDMHSRRVTKSEADFLAEFEAELDGTDFDNFFAEFDEEFDSKKTTKSEVDKTPIAETLSAEKSSYEEENLMAFFSMSDLEEPELKEQEISAMDSFDLGGVDLGALLSEAAEPVKPTKESVSEPQMDVFSAFEQENGASQEVSEEDVFASLFGDENTDEPIDLASMFSEDSDSSEGLDLGNLGEADLMSLLAGEGDLSDLGDMLSQSNSSDVPLDGLDAFAAFAENEMAEPKEQVAEEEPKKKKKAAKEKGKGGFFAKIKEFLLSDDEDEDEVDLKQKESPGVNVLSLENEDILAQLEAEEKGKKGKKEKGGLFSKLKKDKNSKEEDGDKKKKKEKKPKKEKVKKEKKPKAPKEKKEKKPKEVDNTPPLPRGPVILIWVMAISLFALVFIGTNLVGYSSAVSDAKSLYNTGNYAEAYAKLAGITVKEKDMEIYNQVATLATVDSELDAYKVFFAQEQHEKALDSLVCAAGRCELNEDSADVYGCMGEMDILKKAVDNELSKYGMTYDQALEIYHMRDREDYTIALYTKLKELGLY